MEVSAQKKIASRFMKERKKERNQSAFPFHQESADILSGI